MAALGNIPYVHCYKKTAPSDTSNKYDTQQKKHPLMPFKNDDILQKWHMTNTPSKIDKCDTHKKMVSYKNGTPCKREFLNLSYDSHSWSLDFKIEIFPLKRNIPITLLCLIIEG